MTTETKLAPPNSLLLVMDRDSGEIPESMDGKMIVSTPSSVAVGTLSEADGKTSVVLTDERIVINADPALCWLFGGVLTTPKKEIHVSTVLLQSILSLPVASIRTQVEIWANSQTEPSKLVVLVDS